MIVISASTKQQLWALWKCSSNLNMKDSSIFVLNLNTEQSQTLNIYKQSKHEASFVDYKRDYKATTKVQLRVHKLSKHMGIKYNLI